MLLVSRLYMEQLVEWELARETGVLGENMPFSTLSPDKHEHRWELRPFSNKWAISAA
jgi:hypothetical protein